MFLGNKNRSIWDELYWNNDSLTRNTMYKIDHVSTAYGNMSSSDYKDYYSITPGAGTFTLYVTSDPINGFSSNTFNYQYDVKITDSSGQTVLETSSNPDVYTDAIYFSSSTNSTYYVEITNTLFSTFNYAATLTQVGVNPTSPVNYRGSDGNDTLAAGDSPNIQIFGYGGNDHIYAGSGVTVAIGGSGVDTFHLPGARLDYTKQMGSIVQDVSTSYSTTGLTGAGVVKVEHQAIERLQFSDGTLGIDPNDYPATIVRLYQAALNRAPDGEGLSYWVRDADNGQTLKQLSYNFLISQEFQDRFGSDLSDAQFIERLYLNVLKRAPDMEGTQYWLADMAGGQTRTDLLFNFSESAENKANTATLVNDGVWYV